MRRLWTALAVGAVAVSLGTGAVGAAAAPSVAVPAANTGGLSDSGQAAIADLRTCLASEDVLNVYYLIDASGSLNPDIVGDDASDPEGLRAPILANSLEQLGGVDADATVNWSAGFFSGRFISSSEIGWREYQPGAEDQLENAIRSREARGDTNWPDALSHAQASLADQQAAQPGCQLMIWLTDGQLDFRDGGDDRQEIRDALNAMCGAKLEEDGASPSGYGIFNSLRQSGVVVVGALLATNDRAAAAGQVMWPLVEGSVDGGEPTCGEHPIPDGYVHGAFVEAASPDALSQVFLQLGAQVGGGYPAPFEPDGSFYIDPGVSRFRIVLRGDWMLTPPPGSGLAPATAEGSQPWVPDLDDDPGTIDVATADSAMHGTWRLEAGDTRSLFLFSDLAIVFDEQNSIEIGADGAIDATLHARVVDARGAPARLDVYQTAAFTASIVSGDGMQELRGAEVDEATGAITIPMPTDVSAAQITVTASIDPLVTDPHGLRLAPVTTRQTIETVLPSNFPTVAEVPVQLGTLEGSDGQAQGTITLNGPRTGGDGKVCLPVDPEVTSDSAHRDAWDWNLTEDLDADRCAVVPEGAEGVQLRVTASNDVAADSLVKASVPVTFVSGAGGELVRDVPLEFRSTHPINPWAVILLTLGLLILGILLPLLALWLVNWRTTRLDIDPGIQRARFTVRIGPGGISFIDAPASDAALAERFQYRPPQRNVRAIDDSDLGRLAAHVPWFPLAEPTYRITPRSGTTIVGARTSARAASAGLRRDDGSMEFRQLPLDAFWAILVGEAELARTARGDEVNGTAVLYHRMDPSQRGQYRARLNDIGLEGTLSEAVDRARAALAQRESSKRNAPPSARPPVPRPPAASDDPASAPVRDGAPPSRTGATPPPRDATALPARDGSPPARGGGTTPPPLPGSPGSSGSAPPPRPGSPPPPRGR